MKSLIDAPGSQAFLWSVTPVVKSHAWDVIHEMYAQERGWLQTKEAGLHSCRHDTNIFHPQNHARMLTQFTRECFQ